ncbi:hypothetical protein XELAEV_18022332mg [Xenopus laevis]|uniref:Uncharacterized protein n=1 Tax=Xenopus laevis TaxID=8355 RepID=A0A974D424_XENLA|nr:hypothetical protein XELAEV_18022332mg [Xenopus laevis]
MLCKDCRMGSGMLEAEDHPNNITASCIQPLVLLFCPTAPFKHLLVSHIRELHWGLISYQIFGQSSSLVFNTRA